MSANNEDASGMLEDVTKDLHRIDVSLVMGGGVAFHPFRARTGGFRLESLFVEARYERGIVAIDTSDLGVKNRNSALLLGASFVLGVAPSH